MTTNDNAFRLSRLTHPRATRRAMLLVALVFLGFGLVAEACMLETPLYGAGSMDPQRWPTAIGAAALLIFTA